MPSARRIALLVSPATRSGRGILQGISQYLQDRGPWMFCWTDGVPGRLDSLQGWAGDGVIVRLAGPASAADLPRGVPVVNCAGRWLGGEVPAVAVDDAALGRMGARHLLDQGFAHLGFFGRAGCPESRRRVEAFREAAAEAGRPFAAYPPDGGSAAASWEEDLEAAAHWFQSLPRPAGVMAADDVRAWQASEACRRAGLRVPEDAGLLGVDDDDLVCGLCAPPLSSMSVPWARLGYEAAALLDRLMAGDPPPVAPLLVPPKAVVARPSTEMLVIDDAGVAGALRFIRRRAGDPIRVGDVVRGVGASRRSLERRFLAHVRRTISAEIRRAHVERARQLLDETNLPMPAVASGSGFAYPQRFSTVFKRETGLTPTQYRERYRLR